MPNPLMQRAAVVMGQKPHWQKLLASAPIQLLPGWEASGLVATDISGNGRNGAYPASGVTYSQPGIGDGRTSVLLDGSAGYINAYSAGLAAAFNGAEGAIAISAKVANVGVWTDGVTRALFNFRADANNRIFAWKNANNSIDLNYYAGGTQKAVTLGSLTATTWLRFLLCWSKSGNKMEAYKNDGVQIGATQTGLGTWAGSLSATLSCFGAIANTPSNVWAGNIAYGAILTHYPSALEIALWTKSFS